MTQYLTIDVGGTNIKYALMNEEAVISDKGEIRTPMEGLEKFIETILEIYRKYEDKAEAIAMAAPGKIDSDNGYFYTSGALKYISGVNLADRLAEHIKVPFCVENDAKAAALAELWKGSMRGVQNGTVITLGTGIGGALIFGGKLYRGSTYAAGEYSNISQRLDMPFSTKRTWAGQNGVGCMVADYAERIGKDPSEINGRFLFKKANEGEKEALDAIGHYCEGVATGLISLQFIVDVEKVAIGGGISKQPVLMETLNRVMKDMYAPYAGSTPATLPEVVSCEFGNDANMIGALYHYLYEFKK